LGVNQSPLMNEHFISPMLLANVHRIDIYSVNEPSTLNSLLRNRNAIAILPQQDIITTHHSLAHLATVRGIISPILQPIASLPLHSIVRILILVPKLHGDLVVGEGEDLFAELVGLLLLPLGGQEGVDGGGALGEDAAVAPDGVGCVALDDFVRRTGVPEVLGELDFLVGRFGCERRHYIGHVSSCLHENYRVDDVLESILMSNFLPRSSDPDSLQHSYIYESLLQ